MSASCNYFLNNEEFKFFIISPEQKLLSLATYTMSQKKLVFRKTTLLIHFTF